jgi:L-threonylcarbamoyladenylate synthase
VQTQVLKADSRENIKLAASLIRRGEIVAFPTETVYGLGADATNKMAVAKVFAVKGRPASDPLIVHIASVSMLERIVKEIPNTAWLLADAFWPGPLTLVLARQEGIPDVVTAGLPTVAVRIPRNEVALALITEARVPIAAPSANSFGRPSPTCAEHVMEDLGGKIALVLDGGPAQVGIESTVLDLNSSPPAILRPGGVSKESLERILGKVSVSSGSEGEVFKSPGQMKQHYAPRARVLLFNGMCREKVIVAMREKIKELKRGSKIGVMVPKEELSYFTDEDVVAVGLGPFTTMETVARNLFAAMRALDKKGVDYIFALAPGKEGIGLAVFDRLFKAAGSQLIEVD